MRALQPRLVGDAPVPFPTEVTVLHYDIDDELHHRAKVLAAQRRTSLKQLVIEALELATEQPDLLPDTGD